MTIGKLIFLKFYLISVLKTVFLQDIPHMQLTEYYDSNIKNAFGSKLPMVTSHLVLPGCYHMDCKMGDEAFQGTLRADITEDHIMFSGDYNCTHIRVAHKTLVLRDIIVSD